MDLGLSLGHVQFANTLADSKLARFVLIRALSLRCSRSRSRHRSRRPSGKRRRNRRRSSSSSSSSSRSRSRDRRRRRSRSRNRRRRRSRSSSPGRRGRRGTRGRSPRRTGRYPSSKSNRSGGFPMMGGGQFGAGAGGALDAVSLRMANPAAGAMQKAPGQVRSIRQCGYVARGLTPAVQW